MLTFSVSRMLTASASTPNTRQRESRPAPTPGNWHGVAGGMQAARDAVTNNQFQLAEQILNELIMFAPSETSAWQLLARVQRKTGNIEAGIESATRALRLQNVGEKPQGAASLTLARLLWQQGEKVHAIAMIEQLSLRQPEDASLSQLKNDWNRESDS